MKGDRRGDERMLTKRAHKTALAVALAAFALWLSFVTLKSFDYYSYHYIRHHYSANQKNNADDENNGIWGHADPGVTFVSLLLVVVGGVQIAVFLQQLRLIRESLGPAKEAADAAKLNAQAVIDAERAYIFGGGPGGNPSDEYVYGTIENDGRTPGFLKRVDWGICDETAFPKTGSVSKIIDEDLLPKGTVKKIEIEDVYPPTPKSQLYRQIGFERTPNIGKIFFGRFVYHDVFGKCRYSTFKLKLDKKHGSIPLPGSYSDWS